MSVSNCNTCELPIHSYNKTDPESCHENLHKGLVLSSENAGLLGPGSLLGVHGCTAGDSPPRVEDSILPLLHKSKEPYRPPRLFKVHADTFLFYLTLLH